MALRGCCPAIEPLRTVDEDREEGVLDRHDALLLVRSTSDFNRPQKAG